MFLGLWKKAYEALFGGSKGPGKTDCLIMEALRQTPHPEYRGTILRRTYPQLQEIIDRMHKWYPSCNGQWRAGEHRWIFPSNETALALHGVATAVNVAGAAIAVGHMQHEASKYNYQGHQQQYLGFDQLEQFTQTQYLYMLAQQRSGVPGLYSYARSTANPGGIGHGWVKRRFIDLGDRQFFHDPESQTTRVFVFSTLDDNPSLLENDPGYVHRLKLGGENQYKAFRYGDWDSFEGQFFTMWRNHLHVIEPFPLSPVWTRFMSLDYGYASPSSVGWWAVDTRNRLIRYRELYKERLTYTALAAEILERMDCKTERIKYLTADPAIWSDISHHKGDLRGETGAEIMQKAFYEHSARCGCEPIRIIKADNDRINGWIRLRERLQPDADADENVGLQVFNTCRDFIRTIPEAIHDETRPEDVNTEGEDHAIDDARYAVMSRPAASEAPPPLPTGTQVFWEKVRRDSRRGALANNDAALLLS